MDEYCPSYLAEGWIRERVVLRLGAAEEHGLLFRDVERRDDDVRHGFLETGVAHDAAHGFDQPIAAVARSSHHAERAAEAGQDEGGLQGREDDGRFVHVGLGGLLGGEFWPVVDVGSCEHRGEGTARAGPCDDVEVIG